PALLALFGLGFLASGGFAIAYRVDDPESFRLMSYLFVAAAVGFGAMSLVILSTRLTLSGGGSQRLVAEVLSLRPAPLPALFFTGSLERSDRSPDDSVRRYAADILAQPLEPGAAVVGLLGEMTLIRFYQQTEGRRPDLETVAADAEPARLAAVAER